MSAIGSLAAGPLLAAATRAEEVASWVFAQVRTWLRLPPTESHELD